MQLEIGHPDDRYTVNLDEGLSVELDIINNAIITRDYFVYRDDKFFAKSLNEFSYSEKASCKKWLEERAKYLPNMGFKFANAHLNNDITISYEDLEPHETAQSEEMVFVYDYPWGYNYQHWLIAAVGRLFLYKEIKKIYPDLKLLVRKGDFAFKAEMIELVNIHESDIEEFSDNTLYKNVILPDFVNITSRYISPFCYKRYQNIAAELVADNDNYSGKIYLARDDSQGRRPLANRAELDGMLDKEGFEKVALEKLSIREKIILFRTAKYMIGEFSAGWGHIVFFNKDVKAILIEHDVYKNRGYFERASSELGFHIQVLDSPISTYRKLRLKLILFVARFFGKSEFWIDPLPWKINVEWLKGRMSKFFVEKAQLT